MALLLLLFLNPHVHVHTASAAAGDGDIGQLLNQNLIESHALIHAGQGVILDTSAADCARMLGEVPQVSQSREEFQNFLRTGAIPLTPSHHIHYVANHLKLTHSVFAAGSDYSGVASRMSVLLSSYDSAAGQLIPLCLRVWSLSKVNVTSPMTE